MRDERAGGRGDGVALGRERGRCGQREGHAEFTREFGVEGVEDADGESDGFERQGGAGENCLDERGGRSLDGGAWGV